MCIRVYCARYHVIGIYGMDFYVVLSRKGQRVHTRKHAASKVGYQHLVTKEDAIKWFQTKYEGLVLGN